MSIKVIQSINGVGNPTLEFVGLPAAKVQAVGNLAQMLTTAGTDGKYDLFEALTLAALLSQIVAK